MIDIEKYFIKRLKDLGYTVKDKVVGATTIMDKKEIRLNEWYSGFWADMQTEDSQYFKVSVKNAIDKLLEKASGICKKKVIAVGKCGIDKTYHADYQDHFYNIYINFGGY